MWCICLPFALQTSEPEFTVEGSKPATLIYYLHSDLTAQKHQANDKILAPNNSKCKPEGSVLLTISQQAARRFASQNAQSALEKDFQERDLS